MAPSDPRPPARPALGDRLDLSLGALSERQATWAEDAGTWWSPLFPAESASSDSPSRALGSRRRAGGLHGDCPVSWSPGPPRPALGGQPGCGGGGVRAQGDTGPRAEDRGARQDVHDLRSRWRCAREAGDAHARCGCTGRGDRGPAPWRVTPRPHPEAGVGRAESLQRTPSPQEGESAQ